MVTVLVAKGCALLGERLMCGTFDETCEKC